MIRFLENKNIEFVNLFPYLNKLFNKYSFTILTPTAENLIETIKQKDQRWPVKINNELVTCNLRMIGSYVPEKLAILSFKTLDKPKTLQSLIEELSKEKFIYSPPKFAKRIYQYRFIDLVEAFLFSDFFESVWKGNLNSNRCFVIKENLELKYYSFYQSKMLAEIICDNIILKSKFLKSYNNTISIKLHFTLDKKVFN